MKKSNARTIKYLVGAVIYVAIIALIIIFGLMPKLSELTKNQNDLEKKKHELADATSKRLVLEELSEDKTRIDLVNSVTLEYLPQNSNSSDFVVKVEALAKQLNVVVGTFSFTEAKTEVTKKTESEKDATESKSTSKNTSPSSESSTKTTQKAAPQNSSEFTMVISAEYGQILQFLEKMETFPRVNVVDSINVSGYAKEKNTMTLKVVGRIFYGN